MEWDEPEQAPPWRSEDGPPPTMWIWPPAHRPALYGLINGRWRYMPVEARADYADGRVAYQVNAPLPDESGHPSHHHRMYWWPQKGRLRAAHGSTVEPKRGSG